MDISFIIVNWNTKLLTINAINSILNTCPKEIKFEIIVIDNNSSDDSIGFLKKKTEHSSNIIIKKMSKNIGYGPAHNAGLAVSKGTWIFFLNNDIIFLDNCIENMINTSCKDKMAGLYSPKVLNEDMTEQDVTSYLMPYTINLFCRRLKRKDYRNHDNKLSNISIFEMIHGVAYLFHRDFINKYGAWSLDYNMYSEDWDFCFRIYKENKKCIMVNNAKLIHLSQSSSKKRWTNLERQKIMEIANNRFAKKYSEYGCYEIYWFYILIRSFFKGYIKGINLHKDIVRAKIWFIKNRFLGKVRIEENNY